MLNQDKYKTSEERIMAFHKFCRKNRCKENCAALGNQDLNVVLTCDCMAYWLAIEADGKPDPCPFCESSCTAHKGVDMVRPHVSCDNEWCGYRSAEKMLSFARDIYDALGGEEPDWDDFDSVREYIDLNKDDYYEWRRGDL